MQFNPAAPTPLQRASAPTFSFRYGSPQASAEIHAYIASRDLAVADAERNVTSATLNRAFLANELVQNCLTPARSPYQAQSLSEGKAQIERQRCETVTRRLSQLRACSVAAA